MLKSGFIAKYHRPLFYSVWLLLHIIQAATTELFDDEAYYWVYSRFLEWGYFDHPPMIAILIKAGYWLIGNELGVRLFPIILTTSSIMMVESLIEKKNAMLFYVICASVALAQIGGIMAVPDTPLMFFVALFFMLYRRFIIKMNLLNTFLLGVCICLMLYTKYHAVLILLFTGMSNLKMFRHYQTYLASVIALLLFIPHIYWQHLHGYPSVQFHLFERNAVHYEMSFTIDYILGQLLLTGPIVGWLLILAALRFKPSSLTERALKYTYVGVYIFFLLSTIKGKAEANWTIPSFIGLIILSHQYLFTNDRWKKILYYSVPLTLAIVFTARVIMMIDMPPTSWIFKDEFHGNRVMVNAIREKAGGLPVVFLDSYQKPSKYWFYSGDFSLALNTPTYRRNNYNFWRIEDSLLGRPVYVVSAYDSLLFKERFSSRRLNKDGGARINLYYSFSRILIDNIKTKEISNNKISVKFRTVSPSAYLKYFTQTPYDTSMVYLAVYKKKKVVAYVNSNMSVKDIKNITQQNIVTFNFDIPAGHYTGKFSISNCIPGRPSLNSSSIVFVIK